MKEQRRGRSLAMSALEVDEFLAAERTCRVATVGPDGRPHVAPMWFVWHDACLWLNSVVTSKRWRDLTQAPWAAVVVDAGHEMSDLRGVEIRGPVEVVGDVPRTSLPVPELVEPESLMAAKYSARKEFLPDGRHAWLRLAPETVVSWDFRKNPALRNRNGAGEVPRT